MDRAKKHLVLAITLAEHGGATAFVLRLAVWLRDHGHQVTVLAGDGDWLFTRCREANIKAIRLNQMGRAINLGRDLRAVFELKRLFQTLKPDAVHLNSTKMGVIGSLAARLARLPRVVYRIGGWAFLESLPGWRRWFYLQLERLTANWKDTIICVHPGDEAMARKLGIKPRQAIITIANGIDAADFDRRLKRRHDSRQALGLDDRQFVFGTIAHFYPAKNLAKYLQSCAAVARQYPAARFVLIGDGPERPAIEQSLRTLELASAVKLFGNLADAARYLQAFDVFVLPSSKEGMSWALLEAMAASLPCIATDVGANRWLLTTDGGWIVPAEQTQPLADAMIEAMARPDLCQRRSARARRIVEQNFPIDKTFNDNEQPLIS